MGNRWPPRKIVKGKEYRFWGVYQTHSAAKKEKQSVKSFASGSISSSKSDKWHPEGEPSWNQGRGDFALYIRRNSNQSHSPKKSGGGPTHVRSHPRRGTRGVREHTRRR